MVCLRSGCFWGLLKRTETYLPTEIIWKVRFIRPSRFFFPALLRIIFVRSHLCAAALCTSVSLVCAGWIAVIGPPWKRARTHAHRPSQDAAYKSSLQGGNWIRQVIPGEEEGILLRLLASLSSPGVSLFSRPHGNMSGQTVTIPDDRAFASFKAECLCEEGWNMTYSKGGITVWTQALEEGKSVHKIKVRLQNNHRY